MSWITSAYLNRRVWQRRRGKRYRLRGRRRHRLLLLQHRRRRGRRLQVLELGLEVGRGPSAAAGDRLQRCGQRLRLLLGMLHHERRRLHGGRVGRLRG